MTTRRNFLKFSALSGLLPASLLVRGPGPVKKTKNQTSLSHSNRHVPLVVSTWRHGLAANEQAWKVLHGGGTVLDAVEEGVKVTEADAESRSVGLNGRPDREGIVTLDASIMKGNGDCGSVCFLRQIRHPISVARKVMEDTPHVMLAGEGARRFAISSGFPLEEETLPADVRQAYEEWLEEAEYQPEINIENHDTIGMLGLGSRGELAGTCTTSGVAYKMHGRVGDSPIIGAGLYVDDEVGGAAATGLGETVIKISGSYLVVELMRQGRSPREACREAIHRLIRKNEKIIDHVQAAFIAISKDGEYGAWAVRPGFNYAVRHSGGEELIDSESHYS